MPQLGACGDAAAPAFLKGAGAGPATIPVEVGIVDANGVFQPYQSGDWVPMVHGAQGGFHVWAALRMDVKGAAGAKIKMQSETLLWGECDLVGEAPAPVIYPSLVAGTSYVMGNQFMPGLQVRFAAAGAATKQASSSSSGAFCNRWYRLRAAVRDWKSGAWGQTQLWVRTYDTAGAKTP